MSKPKLLVAIAAMATLSLALVACDRANEPKVQPLSGREEQLTRGASSAIEPAPVAPGVAADAKRAPETSAQGGPLAPFPDLPGQKVIKNASIRVEIADNKFQERYSQASLVAEQFGGFVTNSATFERDGRIASGTLTMRVPSDKFQSALAELRKLGVVKGEEQHGQDVTAEFVDLEARLKHLKSQEAFFLRLMDEAKTIADMIQIQQQLSAVQLQIEEVQGRLQFLKDQTTYSTITANIFEEGASTTPPKGIGKAWREALDGFKAVVSGLIVASGWVTPFALMAVVSWVAYRVVRNGRRQRGAVAE